MTERLLHYIWQHQYFNKRDLLTEGVEPQSLQVISPGLYNTDQGPDFKEARIRLAEQTWVGHVELHVKASDWTRHRHSEDPNYQNVVLHVVWENDLKADDYHPPMFALCQRVSKFLLTQYEDWMMSPASIPCRTGIAAVDDIIWLNWKERVLVERLELKTGSVYLQLKDSTNSWEEVFWWMLAKNFGITVNREAFEQMAHSLPFNLLLKHRSQVLQLEALLMGQSGLLAGRFTESYPARLKKEYQFLKKKYQLKPSFAPVHFLRMRPVNFPTVRLAQLAVLLSGNERLFSQILSVVQLSELKNLFEVTAGEYWHYHFRFEETSSYQPKAIGEQMIDNLVINTVVPIVFAYGHYHSNDELKDRAIHWLDMMRPEKNRIISRFCSLGVQAENALDTQALYHLKTQYCDEKKCLDCAVGNAIIKKDHRSTN